MYRFANLRAVLAVLAVLLPATGLQAQTTTGRLIGRVVNEQDGALPGTTVTIRSAVLIGGAQTKIADDDGEFSFLGLHPGDYTVKADLSGYVSQERLEVVVPLGGAASIIIEMPQGTFADEIEIVADTLVIDPTQVNTEQIFTASYLEGAAIGMDNRRYQSALLQTPGVSGGDNPRVFGSTEQENAYFIDGVDTTDPSTSTFGTNFNFDAIQEIQFQTSGFEAEYGRATGGIINLVTKAGGNQFSGAADIRYRDNSFQTSGDHFDSSELDSQRQELNLTLGGPILRDKLWFFVAYKYVDSDFTPIGSPTTRTFTGNYPLAKLTWQVSPSWRVTGKYNADPADIHNRNASAFVEPEATSFSDQGADIYSVELNGVLSESVLWNTTIGIYRAGVHAFPESGNLEPISHINGVTGVLSENFLEQEYSDRDRNDFTTNLTWFIDDIAGSHELKGGIEYSDLGFKFSKCATGTPNGERCIDGVAGNVFSDFDFGGNFPWIWSEVFSTGTQNFTGTVNTAFVQDAWRIARDLTLKIGIRYDGVTYDNDDGARIADMARWQPRLAFAWDLTGNAKNILRGNYGAFMHPNNLALPFVARGSREMRNVYWSCSGFLPLVFGIPIGSAEECAAFAGFTGSGYANDPEGWDPFGWVLPPGNVFGTEPSVLQPGLDATYANTLSLAYEREVGRRASIELTYVNKKTKDLMEDTCNGNIPTPYAEASCDFMVVGNLPGLRRDYQAFIVKYETRSFDWLTLLTSYTYSTSEGNLDVGRVNTRAFDVYPWFFDNRFGYLSDDRRHRFKLNGFFNIKGDWTIGFDYFYSSDFRWEPQATTIDNFEIPPGGSWYVEPRGSRKANPNHQLDLQLSKGFTLGRTRLVLIGSVFNALDNEEITAVCKSVSGCTNIDGDHVDTGGPIDWQTPMRFELGFRVEF